MARKVKQITFWASIEERKRIDANAKGFGLATGTYLRLLGLSGMSPILVPQAQVKISTKAQPGPALDLPPDEVQANTPKSKDDHKKSRLEQ